MREIRIEREPRLEREGFPRALTVARGAEPAAEPTLSVIVPVVEHPEPLGELYAEFIAPLVSGPDEVEALFVLNPEFAALAGPLERLAEDGHPVRVMIVSRRMSETSLLRAGVEHTSGDVIVTLPAYRQVEAAALPGLVAQARAGSDLVVARRWPRRDAFVNRVQNRLLHAAMRGLTEDRLHDVACGVRAIRREVLRVVPLYGDFSRFLPLLALYNGYRVTELPATQHIRNMRRRFHSPGVYVGRAIDVLGLFFLLRFTDKPLRFFGLIGSVMSLVGAGVLMALFVVRVTGTAIGERPLLLLGAVIFILGIQLIALGLVGELIVHFNSPGRRRYRLARGEIGRTT